MRTSTCLILLAALAPAACGQASTPYVAAGGDATFPDQSFAWGADGGSSGGGGAEVGDGGANGDAVGVDAGVGLSDAPNGGGSSDGAVNDGSPSDGGSSGAAMSDSGASDGGPSDGAGADGGPSDAGPSDGGPSDGAGADGGPSDAGPSDGGKDAGLAPGCGDKSCDPQTETCTSCPVDCGTCCGNGKCEVAFGETCASCPADCGPCCGNGSCDVAAQESCFNCPLDCGQCCGDGHCEPLHNENQQTCPKDCGSPNKCGDGTCDPATENAANCPADCTAGQCALPCNPVTQAKCTAASKQCYPNGPTATCTTYGSKTPGQTCIGINECAKGLLCVNKMCKKLCSTAGRPGYTCGAGELCDKLVSSGKELPCHLGACFGNDGCHLISSDRKSRAVFLPPSRGMRSLVRDRPRGALPLSPAGAEVE